MTKLILIVDDNLACAEPLQMALEALQGVEVQVATHAATALKILAENPARVVAVITDLRMPAISGLELLEMMKLDIALQGIPVLIISGDSDPCLPEKSLSRGASAFFTKPYSPLAVRRRVEQLLV